MNKNSRYLNLTELFLVSMFLGIVTAVLLIFFNRTTFDSIFFIDKNDSYMDFFNVIYWNPISNTNGGFLPYPMLGNAIFEFFSYIIGKNNVIQGSFAIRSMQGGRMAYIIFIMLSTMGIFMAVFHKKKGSFIKKLMFLVCILISYPFLFTLERGNIIILSAMFAIFFMFGKDSKNKVVRELSLMCLAISFAIKLYPALLGLVLIKEKRINEAIRCMVYGLLLLILPTIVFKNLSYITYMIEASLSFTGGPGLYYKISISNMIQLILTLLQQEPSKHVAIVNGLSYFIILYSGIVFFYLRSKWKTVTLVTLLIVSGPSFNAVYGAIFMVIPLVIFLDHNEPKRITDYVYLLAFIGVFIPITFTPVEIITGINNNTLFLDISLGVMLITLLIEGSIDIIRYFNHKLGTLENKEGLK